MAGRSKAPNLLRAHSGRELREDLQARLPAIKAKARAGLEKAKTGRPREYTEAQGEDILTYMAEGYSLTEAADAIGVARSTVYRWAEKDPAFATTLARAREALAEFAFSEAYAIPKKILALYDKDPDLKLDPARISAAKLATDSLRWYAERLAPKTYADKTRKIEISGPNGSPVQIAAVTINAESLSDEQRAILRLALSHAKQGEPLDGQFKEVE